MQKLRAARWVLQISNGCDFGIGRERNFEIENSTGTEVGSYKLISL